MQKHRENMALFGVDEFSAPRFWHNGPAPGAVYNFPNNSSYRDSTSQRTVNPTVTGTSVLGMKFKGGVIIAADILGSYGSMARFRDCHRVMKVNNKIMLGCSGDYADYQFMKHNIEQKIIEEECQDDGFALKPKSLHSWLTRILYNRRSKFNPLWTTFVVGGMQDNEPFLGTVDKLGTAYTDPHIATGYGAYIALPLMRDAYEKNPNLTKREVQQLLTKCMQTLYYRDGRSFPKYQLATVTSEGVTIEGPFTVESNWDVAYMIKES